MSACPPPSVLDRLLAENLDSSELVVVTAHLEVCASCQVALDLRGKAELEPVVRLLKNGSEANHSDSSGERFIAMLAELSQFPSSVADPDRQTLGVAMTKDDELPRIDGYEILSELGRGGMGVVYKALHRELNRLVALKMILAGPQLSPNARERFRNEACAVARLRHPNIVQIYDFGEQDGRPFFSMELVEGGNLAAQIGGTPFTARRAASLVETLAHAVEYAHRNEVLHRDLKPANILVAADWSSPAGLDDDEEDVGDASSPPCVVKITDFGLAKEVAGSGDQLTQSGMVLGTPSYIAPEQARGQLESVNATADVYALGAILYELLTGRPPFRAASPLDTLVQVVHELPISVTYLQPRVPQDLATICMKCLEKEPRGRYPSAESLAEDLRRFLDHEPIKARPISAIGRLRRWGKREPSLAFMIATLCGVLASTFAIVIIQRNDAVLARLKAEEIARSESTAQARAQGAQRTAERANVGLIVDRATTLFEEGEVATGLLWLAIALDRAEKAGANDFIPAIRANLAAWSTRFLVPDTSPAQGASTMAVAYCPDGKRLLTGAWDSKWGNPGPGEARLWIADGWKPQGDAILHPGPVICAAISPDGRRAVTGSQDGLVRLWNTADGTQVIAPKTLPYRLRSVAYGPDSSWFLTAGTLAGGHGVVDRWDAETGHGRQLIAKAPHTFEAIAISTDGKHFLTGTSIISGGASVGGEARLWDAATGEPVGDPFPHSDAVRSVAFSPDGKTVLTGCDDGMARMWNLETRRRVGVPQPHAFPVHAAAFSPDGQTVVTGGGRTKPLGADQGEVRLWDVSTGRLLIGPLKFDTNIHAVAWKPDGKSIVTGSRDGRIRIWNVGHLQPLRGWARSSPVMTLAYSPDRKLLFTGGGDYDHRLPGNSESRNEPVKNRGSAWLDDAVSGQTIATLNHSGPVIGVAFSPDGSTFATGTLDGRVRLWNTQGQPLCDLRYQGGGVSCLVFDADGKSLVTCGYQGGARIWEVPSGLPLGILAADQQVRIAQFSPDGRSIATAGRNGEVRLWDAATRQPIGVPMAHGQEVMALAFSPSGRELLAGCDGAIVRWDTLTFTPIGSPLVHNGVVWTISFSDDGARFFSVAGTPYGDWGYVRLWDASTSVPLGPPLPHRVSVGAVAFRPGSDLIATGGWDGDVRIWDVVRGQLVGPALPLGGTVLSLAFDHLGNRLAAAGENGNCRIWAIPDPMSGTAQDVQKQVETLTGLTLDNDGTIRHRPDPPPQSPRS
jgi:WD40 repeat protein/serine/threonine protein kinase